MIGVVTGSIYAVVNSTKGFVIGALVGAVVQAFTDLPHTMIVFACGNAVMRGIVGYWLGSTRLRERPQEGHGSGPIYVAEEVKILHIGDR